MTIRDGSSKRLRLLGRWNFIVADSYKSLSPVSRGHQSDLRYMVRSVSVVKVYYVWTGRNAWWNTWSTKYSCECFHQTMKSAKAYCESRRVQGSVFYIDELPSLAFHAPERTLLVSEINTKSFLSRFSFKRLRIITTAIPVSSMTLKQMWHLFRAESDLWPVGYPHANSAFVLLHRGSEPFERVERRTPLSSYRSIARGPQNFLDWERRPFTVRRARLHRLQQSLASRMGD